MGDRGDHWPRRSEQVGMGPVARSSGKLKGALVGVLTLILLGANGCGILGPDESDDLEEAWERWGAAGILDYDFTLQRGCFCADFGPKRVKVRRGVVESILDLDTGDPFVDSRNAYPAIPGLFDFLADAIDEADEITIDYDRALGFPISVTIDFIKDAIDDELSLTVSEFLETSGN